MSDYATKLKYVRGVDTLNFVYKTDWASLKSDVDKLSIGKF